MIQLEQMQRTLSNLLGDSLFPKPELHQSKQEEDNIHYRRQHIQKSKKRNIQLEILVSLLRCYGNNSDGNDCSSVSFGLTWFYGVPLSCNSLHNKDGREQFKNYSYEKVFSQNREIFRQSIFHVSCFPFLYDYKNSLENHAQSFPIFQPSQHDKLIQIRIFPRASQQFWPQIDRLIHPSIPQGGVEGKSSYGIHPIRLMSVPMFTLPPELAVVKHSKVKNI